MYLRNIKGFRWSHKRVYRMYRLLELNLRIKPRKRLKRERLDPLSVPLAINQVWSMDFMSDALTNGRKLRTFNAIDDYNREGLTVEVDTSLPSERVIRALTQVIEWRGKPAAIRCDNGPEYISQTLIKWANDHKITLLYTSLENPIKMRTLKGLTEQQDMNGWTCICLMLLNNHNCSPLSGFGNTIMKDLTQLSEVFHQGNCWRQLSFYFKELLIRGGLRWQLDMKV